MTDLALLPAALELAFAPAVLAFAIALAWPAAQARNMEPAATCIGSWLTFSTEAGRSQMGRPSKPFLSEPGPGPKGARNEN